MKRLGMLAVATALVAVLALASTSAAQESVDLTIDELGDSGVSGSATVEPYADGQTQITISLMGMEAESSHVNHIHDGTGCGAGEYTGVVETLTNVDADDAGEGTATTMVELAIEDITDGNHVLVIHAGATLADDATPIACGHIPVASIAGPPADEDGAEAAKAPEVGSGGFLNQDDDGIGFLMLLAGALAVFGLSGLGAVVAVRRIRR